MHGKVRYSIADYRFQSHEFVVRMWLPEVGREGGCLRLPAWIPGSYMIRDFARNITEIRASDRRGPVSLRKVDKQTWKFAETSGELVVEYAVYAFDLSVRGAYLDDTRVFFNGTCLFLSLDGHEDSSWTVDIPPPADRKAAEWKLASTLPAIDVDERGFGLFGGVGYEDLIDHPVEIGCFERCDFAVQGIPHRFVVTDGGRFDQSRACRDLAAICAQHAMMFGVLPVDQYLFLTLATADGYGGLEHRDSTSLICKRSDLPATGQASPDKGYRQLLALCSHEYFHLWNVKRIRPESLRVADLRGEAYTELLWVFEGITSYYDELALARSGVLSLRDYLDLFASTVTRVGRTPGRLRQSVAESSFDAWTKLYKQDENSPNAMVSYYAKGALVAFGLDVTLRVESADTLCLDHLMRRLWEKYGSGDTGLPERAMEREVADLLGHPLDGFFADFVYGVEELPLVDWFANLGIGFRMRPAKGVDDMGGYQAEAPCTPSPPVLGARFEAQPGGIRLTHVLAGAAAERAGLAAGDLLVAIDGERATGTNTGDLLRRRTGASVMVHFFRRDRLRSTELPIVDPPADTCDLWLLAEEELLPQVLARRRAWSMAKQRPVA